MTAHDKRLPARATGAGPAAPAAPPPAESARARVRAAALAGPARTISSLFGARVIRAAALRGASEAGLWRALGVRPEDDDFPPVDDERHLEVWERAMRALGDAGFPVFYASTVRIDDYGLLGLACKTAADVGAALRLVEAHLPAYTDAISVRLHEEADQVAVSVTRAGGARLGVRCSVESALAELLGSVRAIAGAPVAPSAVTFTHRSPADTRAHRQHFGVVPRFGAARNAMELDAAVLRIPLLRADEALCRYLSGELAALSASGASARPAATWRDRTRAAMLRELPRTPRIDAAARQLGVSARSLQRHLAGERATFDGLLDETRRELAERLLAEGAMSVAEVAEATGFAESSSFSRAFKRWTGRSPRDGGGARGDGAPGDGTRDDGTR